MKYENFMILEFPSKSCNESFAQNAVADFALQLAPNEDELDDIRAAVSEAVNNAIIHAYPGGLGKIAIRCSILSGSVLDIVIKDIGNGIESIKEAMRPMYTTVSGHSGMGFTIMESFMTECKVESEIGKGTTVHMKKQIDSKRV